MHNRSYMCGNAFLASLLRPNLGILERLEIKEHQASCIFAVFLRKKIKVVLDIEPRCLSVRINRNESATSSIAVSECMLYKIQNCPTDTLVVVIFRNSKTTYFHRGVGLAAFVIRNSAINSIPKRTFFGVIRDLIIQKTEISNSLLCLPIHRFQYLRQGAKNQMKTNSLLKGEFCNGHDTIIGVLSSQNVFSRNRLRIRDFLLENASIFTSKRRSFFNWSCHNSNLLSPII